MKHLLPALLLATHHLAGAAIAQPDGAELYAQYCAGCHGARLEGGTSPGLLAPALKHGTDRDSIYKSIAEGSPDFGMPGFAATMNPAEVAALTDYVLAQRAGKAPKPAPTAAPWAGRGGDVVETLDYKVNVEVWAEKLETPWAIDFLDADRAIVTEKSGPVRVITRGAPGTRLVTGTPPVNDDGQGGMLDVAVDPDHPRNGWVYLTYTHQLENGNAMTRLVRGRIADSKWTEEQVLFEAPNKTYLGARHHYGSRITFDNAGNLYFAIGDRGNGADAQRLDRPNGKIHRIRTDGTIPADNPFVARQGAMPSIYSYGHRNPQGLDRHPGTGDIWDAEHGPRGGDELNIVRPGANYGWPLISYGINYDGSILTRDRAKPGLEQPIYFWRPSTGLCAITFYRGAEFPYWRNHLLVGALAGQDVRLLTIADGRVLHDEVILRNRGRVRDVANGPDGAIYVVLNDPGTILRLSSAGEALR